MKEFQKCGVCIPMFAVVEVIWPACWPKRGQQYEWWRDSEVAGWGTVSAGGMDSRQ